MNFNILLSISTLLGAILLVTPFLGLIKELQLNSTLAVLQDPVTIEILALTVITSIISTILATFIGVAIAYLLTYRDFKGKELIDSFTTLPIVLPPSVAGYLLLLAFGRYGIAGYPLFKFFGLQILFTTPAIIIAQTFVILPFIIRSTKTSFESISPNLSKAARSFGCTPQQIFWLVLLPLAKGGIISGITMAFARSMGEFGATVMVSGTLQTIPIAIYVAANSGDRDLANVLSLVLVLLSFGVIYLIKRIQEKKERPV